MNNDEDTGPSIDVKSESKSFKISLQEMTEEIGAFLHYLGKHSNFSNPKFLKNSNSEICSVWMLIPLNLDVAFREGIEDCILEKEIFTRTLLIVSEPVDESKRIERRRELLKYFSSTLYEDQADQVTVLMNKLDAKSRKQILDEFQEHKSKFPSKN